MSFPRILGLLLLLAADARAEDFQGSTHALPFDDAPINYSRQTPHDPIARLQRLLDDGTLRLRKRDSAGLGYLPSLLSALSIPETSQLLVFSKTSQQRAFISPENPRALYFNDDVYLGYIPGAPQLEIAAVDPQLGAVFYTLDQQSDGPVRFTRQSDCLGCHGIGRSLGVPGFILRSIGTDARGELEPATEISPIDHTTPLADRWAGWFVTGFSGAQTHRGNLIGARDFAQHQAEPGFRTNLASLEGLVDPAKYPARYEERPGAAARSDIVALMVLEHQAHMHNYITRLNFEAQIMLSRYGHVRYLKTQVSAFLRCLLFTEDAPLTAPVVGNPEWARAFVTGDAGYPDRTFATEVRRDRQGRSLRDLDLRTRLFKYPCSYLIDSAAFDALPAPIREEILGRLYDLLTGQDPDPQFANVKLSDRQAILEILRDTKADLPAYWRE